MECTPRPAVGPVLAIGSDAKRSASTFNWAAKPAAVGLAPSSPWPGCNAGQDVTPAPNRLAQQRDGIGGAGSGGGAAPLVLDSVEHHRPSLRASPARLAGND